MLSCILMDYTCMSLKQSQNEWLFSKISTFLLNHVFLRPEVVTTSQLNFLLFVRSVDYLFVFKAPGKIFILLTYHVYRLVSILKVKLLSSHVYFNGVFSILPTWRQHGRSWFNTYLLRVYNSHVRSRNNSTVSGIPRKTTECLASILVSCVLITVMYTLGTTRLFPAFIIKLVMIRASCSQTMKHADMHQRTIRQNIC